MSSQADWSLDYCITCEKQTSEGLYCSQTCRHADFDNVKPSTTSTPPASLRTTSSWSGFVLPPAYDFAASRAKSKSTSTSPVTDFEPIFAGMQTKRSSVSSFAESTTSSTAFQESNSRIYTHPTTRSQPTISPEAKEELQRYEGLFVKSRRQHQQQRHPHQ